MDSSDENEEIIFRDDSTNSEDLMMTEEYISNIPIYRRLSFDLESDDDYFDLEDEIQNVFEREYLFLDNERENKKYYIGIYTIIQTNNPANSIDPFDMFLNCCVSPPTFFQFSLKTIERYLHNYSIIYRNVFGFKRNVEILQLIIDEKDGSYKVIVKTVWLKIFQRKWRKYFNKQREITKYRMKLSSLKYFEMNGKWPS